MTTQVSKPGFFSYVVALAVPPLSFFIQGKWIAGIVSTVLLFIAIPFFFVFGFGIIIWVLMAFWAVFSLGNKAADAQMKNHANMIGEAVAAAQKKEREGSA